MLNRCHYVLALVSILFSSACVPVPVRKPPSVRGPAGVSVGTSPDYAFISPHQTTREEVIRRLGWTDVGLNDSRLFWGRWETSTKGRVEIMIIPQVGTAGESRVWVSHNILVEFDENGVVASAREVEDKSLTSELISWTQSPGRNFPSSSMLAQKLFSAGIPNTTAGSNHGWGSMSVRQEGLEFNDQYTHAQFQVAFDRIASFELTPIIQSIWRRGQIDERKLLLVLRLKLKDKTEWGKEVSVRIDPPFLLAVFKAVMQKNP